MRRRNRALSPLHRKAECRRRLDRDETYTPPATIAVPFIYIYSLPCCVFLSHPTHSPTLISSPVAQCCRSVRSIMATADQHTPRTRSPSPSEVEAAGILPSHGIHINFPPTTDHGRPQMIKHMSVPTYQSPIRHHRRAPSRSGAVKETLDARTHYGSSDDDGPAVHRINQYVIKQEIGRGSFGSVHLAVDQYGQEFVRLSMRSC